MSHLLNYQIRLLLTVDFLVLVAGALVIPFYSVYVEKIGGVFWMQGWRRAFLR
ncbi:hypothetical protein LCH21_03690 [Patescibacteria group bacterium]|nr:hypothetical protein [Patescibacteria group bacterium]